MRDNYVDVIVPVYNVEAYIDATLASLIKQTYPYWKAIVVDDGSTDESLPICQRYAARDERIVVYTKDNGGLSDARNFGLERVTDDFVCFLDGDDTLHPQFLQIMMLGFNNAHVDICGCSFCYDCTDFKQKDSYPAIEFDQNQVIDRYLCNDPTCEESVCNKLFRTSVVKDVRFPIGKIHEDTFVLYRLLQNCRRYIYFRFEGYNVVSRQGSITRSVYSFREYDKVEACRYIYREYMNTMHERLAFNKYLGTLLWFIIKTNGRVANQVAYDELKSIPLRRYTWAKPRFIPFLILYRCRLLPYIKVK